MLTLLTTLSVNFAACHISYLSVWSRSICWTSMNRNFFSSSRSSLLLSNCATPILVLISLSSSSSSSAPSSPTALAAPLPAPLLPLAAVIALPPTALGVPSFSAASRALSALLFRPRFFFAGALTETAEPDTILTLSLSNPTLGDRAAKGDSSGGKEVCRSGWAEPTEVTDIVEGFLRFMEGEGPPSPAERFFDDPAPFASVLRVGSWECDG